MATHKARFSMLTMPVTDHTNDGNFTGQSLSNTGNGKFTIRLAEQQELNYSNVGVTTPHYKSGLCELILRDDTVVYYKRK